MCRVKPNKMIEIIAKQVYILNKLLPPSDLTVAAVISQKRPRFFPDQLRPP
jgi:hypothetical protein